MNTFASSIYNAVYVNTAIRRAEKCSPLTLGSYASIAKAIRRTGRSSRSTKSYSATYIGWYTGYAATYRLACQLYRRTRHAIRDEMCQLTISSLISCLALIQNSFPPP